MKIETKDTRSVTSKDKEVGKHTLIPYYDNSITREFGNSVLKLLGYTLNLRYYVHFVKLSRFVSHLLVVYNR